MIPVFGNGFAIMLVSFSLLGIGNALMQTSLNPLVSNIISADRLASSLAFGQFIKAIASFLAPYLAMWGALHFVPCFGLEWRVLFPLFMTIAVVAVVALGVTNIEEKDEYRASGVADCFRLLANPFVMVSFIGILCHVGIDVGTNTTVPKLLMERMGMSLTEAGFATSLYFIFRTIGCLSGSFLLRRMSAKAFMLISVIMMALSMAGLSLGQSLPALYVAIALVGLGNSNVFSVCFSRALLSMPNKQNEISGLMIMGIFGGTLFPLMMGLASDAVGQIGAVLVMALGVVYLLFYTLKIR